MRLVRNRRRGTARQRVRVPGPGRLVLRRGKKVRRFARQVDEAGTTALRVRPRGKARRKLRRVGRGERARVRVRLRVTYRPTGGEPRTRSKRIRLVRR